ncbi:MAG: hypothetical protein J6T06_03335 [Victivallales bacterium]|nr:hypothetical protein [Victivallales bacterium]
MTSYVSDMYSGRRKVRKLDMTVCSVLIVIGLVWFAAAEAVYDGSLMEDPFLRSGMFATVYVPLATMYLAKAIRGDRRATAIIAGLLAFLVLWAMIAVDVWVTHYKPNCDICHIPAKECFATESIAAAIVIALVGISDVISARMVRAVTWSVAGFWLVRRIMRVAGMVLFTLLSCVLTYWILYVALRVAWGFWRIIAK